VSDAVAQTIVDITATIGASDLILGAPERRGLASLLRGQYHPRNLGQPAG